MREVLPGKQFQLLVVGRIIGHQGELTAVVSDGATADELDDRRIAVAVFQCQMNVGVVAAHGDLEQVDAVHQRNGLGHRRCLIQQILQPHPGLHRGLGGIARSEIGRFEIETVAGQPGLVETVDGSDAVDGGHQACVTARPAQRVGVRDETGGTDSVPFPSGRKGDDRRLGGFRPIHGPARENGEVVVIPQHAGAHDRNASPACSLIGWVH